MGRKASAVKSPDYEVIQKLGGPSAVARFCGVNQRTASDWGCFGIPRPWRVVIAALHPDVFNADARAADSAEAS